jgi:site-specific DNA recombinase
MTVAIYARKSTDQSGINDEQRSVARQVGHAREYATRKGWRVLDEHVYVDDGISGAEFANRPGFLRLMNALKPRAPFQMLIMSEESRLGREAIETAYALKHLEDRERTLDSPTDKIMLSLTAFADELEREKARQRTYDAMLRKARAGHVTGGRVFGYDNVEICGADGQRSHVERRINADEAAIVRRIFELCAAGAGLTRITKTLNAEGAPAPRPQQGRPAAWAPSSVREVLLRPLYEGEIVWNQSRKRDSWGQARRSERPTADWLRIPAPSLQIVPDDLWTKAQAQFGSRQLRFANAGRRRLDINSRFLLSGFARCGRERVHFYGCTSFWKRGVNVCSNNLVARIESIDAEVLATLQDDILRPSVVEQAIALALEELSPQRRDEDRATVERELATVRAECERLAEAIGRGGPLDALLERLRSRQERRSELERLLAESRMIVAPNGIPALEQRLRAKLADWRSLLTRSVETGRDVLRTLLIGPLRFTPVIEERRRGYAFRGAIALDRLIDGIVDLPTKVASPTGFANMWKRKLAGILRRPPRWSRRRMA